MIPVRTLEEDVLSVVHASWHPLKIEELWDALADEGVIVPIQYLGKVVENMARIDFLKQREAQGMITYAPVSFWARFEPISLLALTRKAIKMNRVTKIKTSLFFIALSLTLSSALAAEPDLAPVEFENAAPAESRLLVQNDPQPDDAPPDGAVTPPITAVGTSRPSFTDAWTTVPQGSLQVESGATYTDFSGHIKSWTTPETLLRLGVTDNTELRFTPPVYNYVWTDEFAHDNGLINNFGDISVGLSQHFKVEKFDIAVIPILNIPTGANKASSNSLDTQFRVSIGRPITDKLTLGSHIDTRWNTGRNAPAEVVINTTAIAYYAFTPKFTGFLEYSGFYPNDGETTQFAQGGLLYLLTPRNQIDVRMAAGLNNNSPDLLVGFGYSFRVDGLFGRNRK